MPVVDKTARRLWTRDSKQTVFNPIWEQPFNIEPFPYDFKRVPFKMSDVDRARRKRYLQELELKEHEIKESPELRKIVYNPIRRFVRGPFDWFFGKVAHKYLGVYTGVARRILPKIIGTYVAMLGFTYVVLYHSNDWEMVHTLNGKIYPDRKMSEEEVEMKPEDFNGLNFKKRSVFRGPEFAY